MSVQYQIVFAPTDKNYQQCNDNLELTMYSHFGLQMYLKLISSLFNLPHGAQFYGNDQKNPAKYEWLEILGEG